MRPKPVIYVTQQPLHEILGCWRQPDLQYGLQFSRQKGSQTAADMTQALGSWHMNSTQLNEQPMECLSSSCLKPEDAVTPAGHTAVQA